MFIIKSRDGYWNNDIGWVEFIADCTVFSGEEISIYDLPIGTDVKWVELKE